MANLDIAERRLPQDGRIELAVGGHPVDLRVSVLADPLRRECRDASARSVGRLARPRPRWACHRRRSRSFAVMYKPNGIILVTGPTGSGKTTTLYSALSELNTMEDKVITTEDPVEYDIDGIIQIPIDPEIGDTFAQCLRSILRQDPDRVLVRGRSRPDLETAEIAVQAASRVIWSSAPAHQRRRWHRHAVEGHGDSHVLDHGHREAIWHSGCVHAAAFAAAVARNRSVQGPVGRTGLTPRRRGWAEVLPRCRLRWAATIPATRGVSGCLS